MRSPRSPRGPMIASGIVTGGAVGGIVLFMVVQVEPALGIALWVAALVAVGFACRAWYQAEMDGAAPRSDIAVAAPRDPLGASRDPISSRAEQRRQRGLKRGHLLAKYGDAELVERIVLGSYWHGQTAEQLMESLGNPADIVARIMAGQRKEVWKYHPLGGNRYALWITLEHDLVTSWENRA